jgi:hypothetical protein
MNEKALDRVGHSRFHAYARLRPDLLNDVKEGRLSAQRPAVPIGVMNIVSRWPPRASGHGNNVGPAGRIENNPIPAWSK